MLKILFCGLKYEYGRPELGLSAIEYRNFFATLEKMEGVEAEFFGLDEVMAQQGRDKMNQQLIKRVQEIKPDLLFCCLFTEELKKETLDFISRKTPTKTFNWFTDDHWRFPIFSRYWAPLFTAVSTTDSQAVGKYKSIGINVIKTQWAANIGLYRPIGKSDYSPAGKSASYEITFVGKNYGNRQTIIGELKHRGLSAKGFGKGWDGGMVSFETMLEIFSNSKINLNFTESYFNWPKQLAKLIIRKSLGKISPNFHLISNFQSLIGARRKQIKGRTFEVPATGGFLLSQDADNLRDYYIEGKEIAIFRNIDELAEKCKYYMEHTAERQAIADAGYKRTVNEHTYEKRFLEIFKTMGLI